MPTKKKATPRKRACNLVEKNGEKMHGAFCEYEQTPKSKFAPRSFRMVKTGKTWILVGCPKGKWDPKKSKVIRGERKVGSCAVGMRPHKILIPKPKSAKRRRT